MLRLARLAVRASAVFGALVFVLFAWLASGRSTILESLVTESHAPAPANAILVLTGGHEAHAIPTADGWDRIYTAIQLHADGLAPVIVISGGGTGKISEAEVYASAAKWLGCPPEALVLDPFPGSTAEHPANILKIDPKHLPKPIRTDSPVLVVTSWFHSRRAAMCFRKAGYTNVRVVTSYEARGDTPLARSRLASSVPGYTPTDKSYGDVFNRLRWGLNRTLVSLRELAGIGVYRWQGKA